MKSKKFISSAAALSIALSSFSGISLLSAFAADGSLAVTDQVGWLESAYITWTNTEAVDGYNVYVKEAGGEYKKIDDELVRYYGDYYRADALGLKAGTYQMKVAEVKNGAESDIAESSAITVSAHTREGFAFDSHSSHYSADGVGAYKPDGTLKSGAQVIYVTDANKDSVSLDVITNKKGATTACTGLGEILTARQKGYDTTPLSIRLIGQVETPAGIDSAYYMQIKSTSNITFEGVGNDATAYHWSILLRDTNNVEVRNIAVMEFYDDGISLDTDNFNDWVHNCDIFYGQNRGGDQKKGDGSLDVKSGSDYCSFSYNHFWDSGKTSLCGMKVDNNMGYRMTYYCNWFDHSDSRHPRVRGDQVHLYNNYYDGIAKYGVGACTGSSVYVEKNVFRNAKYAVLSSMQGSDVAGGNAGTFSGEDGGLIKMYDNKITGGNAVIPASSGNTNDFDAYIASSRDETVPSTYTAKQGGTTYSNFDTAPEMYSYSPLDTSAVVDRVTTYAGRMENGDFKHEFTNVDDTRSDRDTVLGNALVEYKTALKTEYATGTSYPATSGTGPTAKPTTAPTATPEATDTPAEMPTVNPTAEPTAEPTATPTAMPADEGETVTDMWRASDTAANVTAGAALKGSWLSLAGAEAAYSKSSHTFDDGTKLEGKLVGKTSQSYSGIASGVTGAVLKFTPDKNGTIGIYYKLNNGKTFYITDSAGNAAASHENTTGGSEYAYISAAVKAGTTYYAFGDGTNSEYWAAQYTTTGAYSDETTAEANFTGTADTPEVIYGIKNGVKNETDYSTFFTITVRNIGDGDGSFDKIRLDADGEEYESGEMQSITLEAGGSIVCGAILEGVNTDDVRNISVESTAAQQTGSGE